MDWLVFGAGDREVALLSIIHDPIHLMNSMYSWVLGMVKISTGYNMIYNSWWGRR